MQTKRDLLQAHRLMTQRAGQALILGEPDQPEQPLRRLNVGTFSGVMVAVLVAAAFGISGLLMGGGSKGLTDGGILLIEKETGSRYVWCQPQGAPKKVLCPVANYSSAKLALGQQGGKQKSVSAKALSEFPRGPMIGIAGAPDTVPEAKRLVRGPWSVCVRETPGPDGRPRSVVSLVGGQKVGGQELSPTAGVVVSTGMDNWLIWKNQRLKLAPNALTMMGSPQPVPVSPAFVNAMPAGPDFKAPAIPGFGSRTTLLGGTRVGQVFKVTGVAGGTDSWYVMMSDGVTRISAVQAGLIQSLPSYGLERDKPLAPGDATSHQSSQQLAGDLPETRPEIAPYSADQALCVIYPDTSDGSQDARLTIGGAKDLPLPIQPSGSGVDNVVLPPGSAILAGVLTGRVDAISTYVFVADNGRKYPLKSPETAQALGYQISAEDNDSVPVPANLLAMLPEGPVLDPGTAVLPVTTAAAS